MSELNTLIDEATGHEVDLVARRKFEKWASDKEVCGCTTCVGGTMQAVLLVKDMFEQKMCGKDALFTLALAQQLILNTISIVAQNGGGEDAMSAVVPLLTRTVEDQAKNIELMMKEHNRFFVDQIVVELVPAYEQRVKDQLEEALKEAGIDLKSLRN